MEAYELQFMWQRYLDRKREMHTAVAAFLLAHPEQTHKQIADATGIGLGTIQRVSAKAGIQRKRGKRAKKILD